MRLVHENFHPNGFKVFLAAKVTGISIDIAAAIGVRHGAQFEIQNDGLSFNLDSNSAVLKLFNELSGSQEIPYSCIEWFNWEYTLQELLFPYYQNLLGKDDKAITESLKVQLIYLNSSLSSKYLLGDKLTAADVVLYASLNPLSANPKSVKLLQDYENIEQYLQRLRSLPTFKEAERIYYGNHTKLAEGWTGKQVLSSQNCTLSLLKGNVAAMTKSCASKMVPSVAFSNDERNISESEMKKAKESWTSKLIWNASSIRNKTAPILPVKGESNILITAALPYVNNVPHLGNIIGCVLSADCFARFCRKRNDNVIYICGTDEYGTATETKAIAENLTPQEICDKYHAIHADVYKWFNIKFDLFGRTTTASQTFAAQSIFWDLYENNKITNSIVEQLYCDNCKRFLADRFVEGTCPNIGCGYDDARGDQCDGCGKLVNATELIKPRCKLCSSTPSLKGSKHLFIDLPKIVDDLKDWLKTATSNWTPNAKVICDSWVRDGLKERCITRDLKWGTPVPLDGFKDKVFYVWYDAPIGYISMTMEYTSEWEKWWKNPEDVQYYEFMAKDNVPFHGVIFPSCQIGTKRPWTKVTHLMATEYLNYEDGKFSKSRGVGVFGDQAKETGISSDVWRFYLLYLRPESHDTAFSWSDLQMKNNSELLNNLGNFVNRSLKFVYQFYAGVLPPTFPNEADVKIMAGVNQELEKYTKALGLCKLREGIRCILSISKIGNQYIQENEPYKLIKPDKSDEEKKRGATVISISVNIVALVAILLEPYMPDTSQTILDVLNIPSNLSALPSAFTQFLSTGHKINEPSPLVRKITDDEVDALRKKFAGTSEPVTKPTPTKDSSTDKAPNINNMTVNNSPEGIKALENFIDEQGSKVREMKSKGATKEDLQPEITKLLQLKAELAIAQGVDPSAVKSSSSKKNKKKK